MDATAQSALIGAAGAVIGALIATVSNYVTARLQARQTLHAAREEREARDSQTAREAMRTTGLQAHASFLETVEEQLRRGYDELSQPEPQWIIRNQMMSALRSKVSNLRLVSSDSTTAAAERLCDAIEDYLTMESLASAAADDPANHLDSGWGALCEPEYLEARLARAHYVRAAQHDWGIAIQQREDRLDPLPPRRTEDQLKEVLSDRLWFGMN